MGDIVVLHNDLPADFDPGPLNVPPCWRAVGQTSLMAADMDEARAELHARVDNDFTYHPPTPDQVPKFEQIREEARGLAHTMVELCPMSDVLARALDYLNLAVMEANAAIARYPVDRNPG